MNNVATLIVKGQSPERLEKGLAVARQLIEGAGATIEMIDWLAPGEALDLFFTDGQAADINTKLGQAMRGLEIDSFVQASGGRKAHLLVADMDSTIIENECINELADALGVKDQIAPITEAAMQGQIDFAEALKARVGLIKGLEIEQMERIRDIGLSFSPGAGTLVATMNDMGASTLLVSGGFTFFSDFVAGKLGFDRAIANRLEIKEGRLTGQLIPPIVIAESKREALLEATTAFGLAPGQTLAVGDGANDVPMFVEAGLSVAYHAKLQAIAAANARIDFAGLEAILFYQGYRRSEFVNG